MRAYLKILDGSGGGILRITSPLCLALCVLSALTVPAAPAAEEIITGEQPGNVFQKEREVLFKRAAATKEVPVAVPQPLDYDDVLRTLALSRAAVRLTDQSQIRLRELTRLEIRRQPLNTNLPVVRLDEGQIYVSSQGKPVGIPIETAHVRGVPRGTEFLVSADPQANRTEVTMFDGEVDLSDGQNNATVRRGQQGIAVPGQGITVRPILEAKNIVQWWIYYPGVLDLEDVTLPRAEQEALSASLEAYRAGDLVHALEKYPGYPAPAPPGSDAQRTYLAALFLAVGAVDKANLQLSLADSAAPTVRALRMLIDAVSSPGAPDATSPGSSPSKPETRRPEPQKTASELLALSYSQQSTNNLKAALQSAQAATERSPNFGFAWARVAELEFSFGRTGAARKAVERSLQLTPSNAQAHALLGFLLAAGNRFRDAIASFDRAIDLDPALGNAWLGRGLCRRRLSGFQFSSQISRPSSQDSWLSDLQAAAMLEPRRSLLRSYLGKGWSESGDDGLAMKELDRAKDLDPNDPTTWLYSALLDRELNRINPAIEGLERSVALNDNRQVYRSQFLLDEDRAVRSSGLANIYQVAGMDEVSLQEAARSVSYDYANYSAHLFLADSYDALRDPTRFNLRYETPWYNEWLLANLLSPVGGTPLSQHISQQEYTRFFERDRVGLVNQTEYRSDGQVREVASVFGNYRNTGCAVDLDYQYNNGVRPNNQLDRLELYATVKQQLSPQDSLLFLTKIQNYHSGDNFQYYDPANARPHFTFDEYQAPALIGGYHREWAPGVDTVLLGGRLQNDQTISDLDVTNYVVVRDPANAVRFLGSTGFDESYQSRFDIYTGELNQIFRGGHHTLVLGGRLQTGTFTTHDQVLLASGAGSLTNFFPKPPADDEVFADFERVTGYAYWTWEVLPHLLVTPGVAYDWLRYPQNFRHPPIAPGEQETDQISPKAAVVWSPFSEVTFRGAYTRSLGGVSFDESYRLEPTQLAGFSQSFRSLMPESLVGSVSAPSFETAGLGFDLKLKTRSYVTIQAEMLESEVDQTLGVFQSGLFPFFATPSSLSESLDYHERSFSAVVNQLVSDEWSFGVGYRFNHAELETRLPEVPLSVSGNAKRVDQGDLHRVTAFALFNHPSGWFARADLNWYIQSSSVLTYPNGTEVSSPLPGDSFPQLNLLAGYRFRHQRAELALGVLNSTGEDYHLNPVNLYEELPRERVFYARLRFRF